MSVWVGRSGNNKVVVNNYTVLRYEQCRLQFAPNEGSSEKEPCQFSESELSAAVTAARRAQGSLA